MRRLLWASFSSPSLCPMRAVTQAQPRLGSCILFSPPVPCQLTPGSNHILVQPLPIGHLVPPVRWWLQDRGVASGGWVPRPPARTGNHRVMSGLSTCVLAAPTGKCRPTRCLLPVQVWAPVAPPSEAFLTQMPKHRASPKWTALHSPAWICVTISLSLSVALATAENSVLFTL